ncbi:MAG: hypothetical protein ACR2PX_17925 [Endozoicomonas sp.]|uniref:hypothetical protein n=1 Tax=Endozoicomonas sp. TaxID=1892382 RepID=UPI003D9BC800
MFPEGVDSENNHCFEIKETTDQVTIGHILIKIYEDYAFIHDFEIYKAYRR